MYFTNTLKMFTYLQKYQIYIYIYIYIKYFINNLFHFIKIFFFLKKTYIYPMLYFEAVHQYTPASKIFMEWSLKQKKNSKPWNKVIIYKEKSVYREYIILFGIWLFVCNGATEKNKQLIEMHKQTNKKKKNPYSINKLSIKTNTQYHCFLIY